MAKVTAKKKVKMNDLVRRTAPMVGPSPALMELTEGEKMNMRFLLEKAGGLQAELQKVDVAIKWMVGQAVTSRGLDALKFGINLAAGRILPVMDGTNQNDGQEVSHDQKNQAAECD